MSQSATWTAANAWSAAGSAAASAEPLTRKDTGNTAASGGPRTRKSPESISAGGGPRTRTSELPRGSPSGPPLSCARTGSTSGKPPPNGKRRVLHQSLTEPDRPACNEGKSLDPENTNAPLEGAPVSRQSRG